MRVRRRYLYKIPPDCLAAKRAELTKAVVGSPGAGIVVGVVQQPGTVVKQAEAEASTATVGEAEALLSIGGKMVGAEAKKPTAAAKDG